jgi:Asp-tRNA(Asn)/Glu-tRNA(Gln) amidotransferase A subunit family amidase
VSAASGDDLAWLSLADAADGIRRRLLSPVELTRALIDRIARLDPAINAFLRFTPEAALAEAKAAEAEISSGRYQRPYTCAELIRVPICGECRSELAELSRRTTPR